MMFAFSFLISMYLLQGSYHYFIKTFYGSILSLFGFFLATSEEASTNAEIKATFETALSEVHGNARDDIKKASRRKYESALVSLVERNDFIEV